MEELIGVFFGERRIRDGCKIDKILFPEAVELLPFLRPALIEDTPLPEDGLCLMAVGIEILLVVRRIPRKSGLEDGRNPPVERRDLAL